MARNQRSRRSAPRRRRSRRSAPHRRSHRSRRSTRTYRGLESCKDVLSGIIQKRKKEATDGSDPDFTVTYAEIEKEFKRKSLPRMGAGSLDNAVEWKKTTADNKSPIQTACLPLIHEKFNDRANLTEQHISEVKYRIDRIIPKLIESLTPVEKPIKYVNVADKDKVWEIYDT